MTAIEMRLFSQFELRDIAGRALIVKAKKSRALLAVLALAPSQTLPRERMTSLLWSDRGYAQARSSLRQALLGLRSDLGPAALNIDDNTVSINPAHVGVDAVEFQRLAASNDPTNLRRAYSLYRGELLADIFIHDAAFEEWLAAERQRLADTASSVIERLCFHETGATRIDLAKRLVALDPLREGAHRVLMQAYLDTGERGLALRQYELCRDLLRDELQISPDEQTEALRRRCMGSPRPQQSSESSRKITSQVTKIASPPAVAGDRPLLAILPFQAFSSDPEMESFCDGLTDDIITGLSRVSAIRVIARSTMFTFKHRAIDIRDVGRNLGASYALEGSVRTIGANIRVVAQLIDAVNGHHIWADQFDQASAKLFDEQNEVTKAIVASVQTQLMLNEGRIAQDDDEHSTASRLLTQAWRRFLGLTQESLDECKALADRALKLEPRNATAHRMLAIAIYHQIYMGFVPWDPQEIDRLFRHARISIESEGADEFSHWAMECAYLLKGQHELAAASLRRALEINPNFSLAYGSMGTVLAWSGDYDESVKSNELALRVNAQEPSNFFRHFGLALAHYLAQRPEKALTHARIVVQARSNWWLGQVVYAASLVQVDRLEDARRIISELKTNRPDVTVSQLARLPFAKATDRERLLRDMRLAGLLE